MLKDKLSEKQDKNTSQLNSEEKKSSFFDLGKVITKTDSCFDKLVTPVGYLVLIIAVISVYEVFMRYLLNSPTQWVHETTIFLVAIVFLLGGVRAMARNQHIHISLVEYLLPEKYRIYLILVNRFILLIACVILTYVSAETAWQATHARAGLPYFFERSGTGWNPPFPAWIKITLFVSCFMMTIQVGMQLCYSIKQFSRSRK